MKNMDAILQASAPPDTPVDITPAHKAEWNRFLDFLNEKGMRGNKALDVRDTKLGEQLLNDYKSKNPESPLTYDMVKPIQEEAAISFDLMKRISSLQGVKALNAEDRPMSKPDGWLGSQTSNMYFPVAKTLDSKGNTVKDYGFDLDNYYQEMMKNTTVPMGMNK